MPYESFPTTPSADPAEDPMADAPQTSRYPELARKVLTPGPEDAASPQTGDQVKVHYSGFLAANREKFDSSRDRGRPFEFVVGKGQVIRGWDEGVLQMRRGETCVLKVPAEMGYGAAGAPPRIPADADLDFHVELLDFGPKPRERWELSCAEKLAAAGKMKEEGTAAFKGGDVEGAFRLYMDAASYLEGDDGEEVFSEVAEKETRVTLLTSCYLNASQMCIKLGRWEEGLRQAKAGLAASPRSEKALYKAVICATELREFEAAKADIAYWVSAEVNPASKEARELHRKLQAAIKADKAKQQGTYAKMFSGALSADTPTTAADTAPDTDDPPVPATPFAELLAILPELADVKPPGGGSVEAAYIALPARSRQVVVEYVDMEAGKKAKAAEKGGDKEEYARKSVARMEKMMTMMAKRKEEDMAGCMVQ